MKAHSDDLVDCLGLAVGLRVEGRAHELTGASSAEKLMPKGQSEN